MYPAGKKVTVVFHCDKCNKEVSGDFREHIQTEATTSEYGGYMYHTYEVYCKECFSYYPVE